MNLNFSKKDSFTLIELLVVIAILAILSVAIVLIINPADIIRQSRDTSRLTDLNNLDKALGIFNVTNSGDFTGTSSVVYVSVPDTTTTCANLNLPALPGGYTYQCVTSSTLTKVDGTGWIPVNFQNISHGSPLNRLPIDPVNTTSTGEYYTYVMGGSWELNAILTSEKYRNDDDVIKKDMPGVLSIGSNKTLSPIFNNSGIVSYWKFDEGTGTTIRDRNNGNVGTLTNSPSWTSDSKSGKAINFNGTNSYTTHGSPSSLDLPTARTISVWVKPAATQRNTVIDKGTQYWLEISNSNTIIYRYWGADSLAWRSYSTGIVITPGSWYHIALTEDHSLSMPKLYLNGREISFTSNPAREANIGSGTFYIGAYSGSYNFNGVIDELMIFNRGLSEAEVRGIYNSLR